VQDSSPPRKRGRAANFWWKMIPVFVLVILNEAFALLFFTVRPYADNLGYVYGLDLGFLKSESDLALCLQYLVLLALILILLGILRGRATGKARSSLVLSLIVCLYSGGLAFIILSYILGLVIGVEVGLGSFTVFEVSPILIGVLLIMGAVFGGIGGLIGSHLLRRRPSPEAATPP